MPDHRCKPVTGVQTLGVQADAIKRVLLLPRVCTAPSVSEGALAEEVGRSYVRIAALEIDPAQLERFKDAAKAQIEAAMRVEPGVLALYAVSVKDNPSLIRVFEIYADADAYKAHLETPHFKKFRESTNEIVKSRKLIDTVPIMLGAKAK
jgi:quinol monooxygenase YgiN